MNKTYITTSIPYVNDVPHIGYALEAVQADALARFYRLIGNDTYFLAGTDENAIKNVESAEKKGITPKELVDQNSLAFQELKNILNLSFDQFIRTSSEKHFRGAQKIWRLCKKDIYKKEYQGLYCVGCETFYKDGEFKDNICPSHNRKLELVTEENYFFALSKYEDRLKKIIESNEVKIFPEYRKSEILNFIKKGLEDFSISRPTERTKNWGIPVPDDDKQNMYVWFDALTNYITALGFDTDNELFQKFWLNNDNKYHLIGKDIIKFHTLYWPAMLLSANLPLPNKVYVHGFITVDGKKMSKTIGNVIKPKEIVDKYGVDAVRFYLLKEIPSLDDGDFSYSRMTEIFNSDLANELGNLIIRITNLSEKDNLEYKPKKYEFNLETIKLFENYNFNLILEKIWIDVKRVNKEIDDFAPWKKNSQERYGFLLQTLDNIAQIGHRLLPLLPNTGERIINLLQGKIKKAPAFFPKIV
jgi:methionyl-tRNA synthetase